MNAVQSPGEADTEADGLASSDPSGGAESSTEAEPAPDSELPLDVVFDILRVERRRRVLDYLFSESERTTLSDLAEHVAALENDKPEDAITSQERKRVYVGLYQCHLPRMDDADVVDFDSDRKTVEPGPYADQLRPHLELARQRRARDSEDGGWGPFSTGVGAVGGLVPFLRTLFPQSSG